jgi:dTDP-4-amino-4,6-dideoxygalactose transaminase
MKTKINQKIAVEDLSYLGGHPLFEQPKSTSSLAQPNFENFLHYSKLFFDRQHYTNNGILVKKLESRLAKFHNTEFCITFCSGFWGLVLAMRSLALKNKIEIIMPSLTYRRMADVATWAGLKPHFCEVDINTLAHTRSTVEGCINKETALILAVHPIVNCCDAEEFVNLGAEYGIPVLFDSVESVYESISAGKIGKFGNAECFSMHASKLLNGFEGGYVTTNDHKLAHRLGLLRTYGFEGQDNCVIPGGLNAKLNEIHAAMALANLDELEQQIINNRQRYRQYQTGLSGVAGIRLLEFDESLPTSYKNIVVELSDLWPLTRDETVSILNAENILARAYYDPPLHQKHMNYPHVSASLPATEFLAKRFMLLPCGDFVTKNDIEQILTLLQFIHTHGNKISDHLTIRVAKKI